MNPSLETYIKTLEESNEDLSKRLADMEAWVEWKSRPKLKFIYSLKAYGKKVKNFTEYICSEYSRSEILSYFNMMSLDGEKGVKKLVELAHHMKNVYHVEISIHAFKGKDDMEKRKTQFAKVLIGIYK